MVQIGVKSAELVTVHFFMSSLPGHEELQAVQQISRDVGQMMLRLLMVLW